MDRYAIQYDKASMKRAILKQEEIFRKQVHELHRLYQIQKLLMRELKNTPSKLDKIKLRRTSGHRYIGNGHVDIDDGEEDIEVELTLAIGSNRKKKDASSPATNSGGSFCSSSTDSGRVKLTSDDQWDLFLGPNVQLNVTSGATAFDVKERKSKGRMNQTPWSIPCLRLKMT